MIEISPYFTPSLRSGPMPSQFHDLDLQDIQFLIQTAAIDRDGEAFGTESYEPTVVLDGAIDAAQAMPLINAVLPFEACLYHQILPLYVEGNQLFLGMVNLEDTAALDYARKILGFLKYQVITQTIPSDAHHKILSAYLSLQSQRESMPALPRPQSEASRPNAPDQAEIEELMNELTVEVSLAETVEYPLEEVSAETLQLREQDALTQWPIAFQSKPPQAPRHPAPAKPATPPIPAIPGSALPELQIQPVSGDIRSLSPQDFLQALLLKAVQSGVGRLFLARQDDCGRVIWTESGEVKAVLENIDVAQLQGAIDALKVLTHLPNQPVREPVEVEIERLYQRQRVLLRLRIAPKATGEEATLQILRGAALKFYQQQQMKILSRDTMTIAAQLRHKVTELQKRAQTALVSNDEALMPELDRVIEDLTQQLTDIKDIRSTMGQF
jgi:hypothetical protein